MIKATGLVAFGKVSYVGGNSMRTFYRLGCTVSTVALFFTMLMPLSVKAETRTIYSDFDENQNFTTTVTNEDTKQVVTWNSTEGYDEITNPVSQRGVAAAIRSELKVKTVAVKSYFATEEFFTTADVEKLTNFKSKSSKLKVKVLVSDEYTDQSLRSDYDYSIQKDGKTTYYYRNVMGTVVSRDNEKYLPSNRSAGKYTVRFYAKKKGTYKVSYDAILKNGTTVNKTFKVIAREDGSPVKSVTYAGKQIFHSDDSEEKEEELWLKGMKCATKRKSGPIKVVMNKGFSLKAIEIGTPSIVLSDSEYDENYKFYKYTRNPEISPEQYDYDRGLEPDYKWKKVKNGKKIKLGKVNEGLLKCIDYKQGQDRFLYKNKYPYTTTAVRITYFDKKDKTTHRLPLIYIYKAQ